MIIFDLLKLSLPATWSLIAVDFFHLLLSLLLSLPVIVPQKALRFYETWIKSKSAPADKTLQLFVKSRDTIVVNVSGSDTAYQLKRLVGFKIGIGLRDFRLVYGTKDLADNCRLGTLPNLATIHLSLRLLGGCGNKKVQRKEEPSADTMIISSSSSLSSELNVDDVNLIPTVGSVTTTRPPKAVRFHIQLKGYTNISAGIDLITRTERKVLQRITEALIANKSSLTDEISIRKTERDLFNNRSRMQVMKIEDELAVLMHDKKNNADGDKMINFYNKEQRLGQQQYLDGDEFESNTSRQLKNIATQKRQQKADLIARKKRSEEKKPNAKKQKVRGGTTEGGTTEGGTTWTREDNKLLTRLSQQSAAIYQQYLIELRVIKVELCEKGLKFESAEARQLFRSFQDDAGILTQRQRNNNLHHAKQKETRQTIKNEKMRDLCDEHRDNHNARTVLPRNGDSAKVTRMAQVCRLANKLVEDVDENNKDILEMIECIAQNAMSKF